VRVVLRGSVDAGTQPVPWLRSSGTGVNSTDGILDAVVDTGEVAARELQINGKEDDEDQ